MRLHFYGAARQVTGSRYLLEAGGLRIMIDCGLFQERRYLDRNWAPPPVSPNSVDYVVLTHAHLDHVGLLPKFVNAGYDKTVLCTEPTVELADIVMMDSARIHEEDAKYKAKRHKREGRKGPHPDVPLYTVQDAEKACGLLVGHPYNERIKLNDSVSLRFIEAGHILGSSCVEFTVREHNQTKHVLFSGDIGQHDKPLIRDPDEVDGADYVVMESTYGGRNHRDAGDAESQLERVIKATAARGGNVIIPTFAIERAQELMFHLGRLVHADRIPDLPISLDSPMAVDVTEVFYKFRDYMDKETRAMFDAGNPPLRYPGLKLVRSVDQSKALNEAKGSNIIMSASGMCTAGRIKHHLAHNIGRPESTIVFVGYQAEGTLGRIIVNGAPQVRIHGREFQVRARIEQIHGFSAHADNDGLLDWCKHFHKPPKRMFLTHGEESAAFKLREEIRDQFAYDVDVPKFMEAVDLD